MQSLKLTDIIYRAYEHTKNHKFLWFFGLFLSGWGTLNFIRSVNFNPEDIQQSLTGFWRTVTLHPGRLVSVVIGTVLISFGLFALGALARIAIIHSALHLERKEVITLRGVLKSTHKPLWRVFWAGFCTSILTFLIFAWIFAPIAYLFAIQMVFRGTLLSILGAAIFLPAAITLSLVNIFAACYMVVYDLKFWAAVRSAFDLFFTYWTKSLLLLFALAIIYFTLFYLSASLLGLVGLLALALAFLLKSVAAPLFFAVFTIIISLLVILLVSINAVLNTFTNFAWTIFFLRMVKAKEFPEEEAVVFGGMI